MGGLPGYPVTNVHQLLNTSHGRLGVTIHISVLQLYSQDKQAYNLQTYSSLKIIHITILNVQNF